MLYRLTSGTFTDGATKRKYNGGDVVEHASDLVALFGPRFVKLPDANQPGAPALLLSQTDAREAKAPDKPEVDKDPEAPDKTPEAPAPPPAPTPDADANPRLRRSQRPVTAAAKGPVVQPGQTLKMHHRGGGWYDVINTDTGERLNDGALKKADAEALVNG